MIKDCKVVLNNEAVTVVRFDNIEIQFPSIHRNVMYVRVLHKNGEYSIVDDDYEEPVVNNINKKKDKKTTIDNNETEMVLADALSDEE